MPWPSIASFEHSSQDDSVVDQQQVWDTEAAQSYDTPGSGMFSADILGPTVDVLKELAGGGMTMLVATHEMEFARNVCDRVMVMVDGQIIEEGEPHVVMTSPTHERTQAFLRAVLGR